MLSIYPVIKWFNLIYTHVYIEFTTVTQHGDRGWNRTNIPIFFTPSLSTQLMKGCTTPSGSTPPTLYEQQCEFFYPGCWSGRELNPRPPARQTGAYPIERTGRHIHKSWSSLFRCCFFLFLKSISFFTCRKLIFVISFLLRTFSRKKVTRHESFT